MFHTNDTFGALFFRYQSVTLGVGDECERGMVTNHDFRAPVADLQEVRAEVCN